MQPLFLNFFIFFKIINFIYNSDDISNVSSFPCLCCNIPYSEFDIPPRRICKCRQSFDSVSDDNNTTHGSQLSNIFPVSSCSPVNSTLSIIIYDAYFLCAISLLIGFPFSENFCSYSVIIFPLFISS